MECKPFLLHNNNSWENFKKKNELDKEYEQATLKDDKMTNNTVKKKSESLVIWEIKTTMRFHLILIRIHIIQN